MNNEDVAYESSAGGRNHKVEMRQNGAKIDGIFGVEKNTIVFEQFPYMNQTFKVTGTFTPDCRSISWSPIEWVWSRPAAE
jgi:hypothetical protein